MTSESKQKGLGGRDATDATIPGDYAISVGHPGTPLPEGWVWTPLNDLADLSSGHTPSRKRPDYWGGEIPWIGIKDATRNHGRTITSTNEFTNELGIKNSAARILPKGTVCLSRTASVGYVVTMGREMATSQDFVNWTCSPRLDPRFLKYALIVEGDALLRFASGSVHQTIYVPEVKAFHLATPSLEEQQAIADLLGALDDKIEMNRRMNETLEEMARALFRDWFVDFGPTRRQMEGVTDACAIMGHAFPPEKATTLAPLFPAKLGEDGLPEGWSEQPVGELSDIVGGGTPNTKTGEFWEGGTHLWATPRDLSKLSGVFISKTERKLTDAGLAKVSSGLSPKGSVLMSSRAPIGYLAIASEPVAVNQGFITMRPTDQFPTYFAKLWCETNMETIEANANGSTFQEISKKNFKPILVTVASEDVVAAFSDVAGLLFDKVQSNEEENQTLAEMRDLLLPKLMSGEIRLKDAEGAA